MRYDNQSCPVCEHVFTEGDDVVVCPECGTPHHRECWHNAGGCANAPLHAEGFEWMSPAAPQQAEEKQPEKPDIICPNCGTHNPAGTPECESCGMKFAFFGLNFMDKQNELDMNAGGYGNGGYEDDSDFNASPADSEPRVRETLDGVAVDDIREFVRANHVGYVNKFKRLVSGRKLSFNWAAFIFSPYWFFYRKMIKPGIVFFSIQFLVNLVSLIPLNDFFEQFYELAAVTETAGITEAYMAEATALIEAHLPAIMLYNALFTAVKLVAGFLADRMYKKHVFSGIASIESSAPDKKTFHLEMFRAGGVSITLPMIAFIVGYILEYVVALL